MTGSSKTPPFIYFIILVLPFLMLYWIMPFISDVTLGRDYQNFSINEQKELFFSIKTGSFPLYVPGYHMGHSSSALTMGQIFHPIPAIASVMPGYWNGKALQWYTVIKLISLGLTQLALFVLLRNLKFNSFFSFLLSFITVYNLRMLDMFRFGSPLEAYTGYLLLCTAISWYYICPASRERFVPKCTGPLSITITTYLLIVSGHPQHMYYGLLGTGLFLLVAPFFLSNILDQQANFNDVIRFWFKAGIFMTMGILLSSVYVLPFYFDFLPTNAGRVGQTYEWSVANIGFYEMLGNFFMPYFSDIHGAFGSSSLVILALLLPILRCFKIKIPRTVWGIWGIILLMLTYNLGDMTPVYKWVWKYFPFVSSFRHQGRSSIIIPIFLMMLLAWIIKTEAYSFRLRKFSAGFAPYSVLALIASLLIPVYLLICFLLKPYLGELPPIIINKIPRFAISLTIFAGEGALIGLILHGLKRYESRILGVAMLLMAVIQVGVVLRYGTFVESFKIQSTFEQMKAQKKEQLDYRSLEVLGMETFAVTNQLKHSFIEPFLGKIYSQIIPVNSQDEAYYMMRRERIPQQLFIEGYDVEKVRRLTEGAKDMKEGTVRLVYSSFNQLQFYVYSEAPAFLGLSYPYSRHWSAWVNGEKVSIYRANGAAHAVEIPQGESMVEFRYWSDAFFWGMVISCATFTVIGLFACFSALNGFTRIIGIVFILTIGAGGFMLWNNSLYNGDNLGTDYVWYYMPPLKTPNLAYGKKTFSASVGGPSGAFLHYHSSHAIDGDTNQNSVFPFKLLAGTDLTVDLNQKEEIKTIVLYGELKTRPEISLSPDGIQWRMITSVNLEDHETVPLRIIFEKPQSARFVKVKASKSEVGIDELEVYGPAGEYK